MDESTNVPAHGPGRSPHVALGEGCVCVQIARTPTQDVGPGNATARFARRPYIPMGWRAMYPDVDIIELDQRVPVSCWAMVSKRLPSTTIQACSELA